MKKYGKHNFSIKTIFICNSGTEANYYETKFIRQYKTLCKPHWEYHYLQGISLISEVSTESKIKSEVKPSRRKCFSEVKTPDGGMNIMRGGKCSPLSKETKKKLSESKKGKYVGDKNPNYGKKTSEEAKQKMREKLTGKKLKESVKENMKKNHKERKDKGILPPRRKHNDLPKYIYHVKNAKYEGYEIRNHNTLKNRKFCSMKISLEEKLELAKQYLVINN